MRARGILAIAISCGLGMTWPASPISAAPAQQTPPGSSLQADALKAFKQGRFDDVVRLLEGTSPEQRLSADVWRAGVRSALRVGRPDTALTFYTHLVPPGKPDDTGLLRDLAFTVIARHVRDPQEHLRIAAYLALADIAPRDAVALFEDGLLDSSVMVRARAGEGLARAGSSATRSALLRALDDPAPSVRIAALNALGAKADPGLRPTIIRLSKSEEGVLHIFALAALARMGQSDAVDEIASEATLPDAELRMAAVGALGQLKRPASLPILSQSVYDPDPSVRAFAAGALGDLGNPKGEPALLHALEDDDPRVRSVAAASLGTSCGAPWHDWMRSWAAPSTITFYTPCPMAAIAPNTSQAITGTWKSARAPVFLPDSNWDRACSSTLLVRKWRLRCCGRSYWNEDYASTHSATIMRHYRQAR